jgi:hypothetical protein
MARFEHPSCMDNGLAYIRANCTRMALISAFTLGQSYATVVGNILAAAPMTPDDLSLSTSGNNRLLTVASKVVGSAAANGGGANSHVVLLNDDDDEVLYVTEEDEAETIVAGSPVSIAGFVITRTQPVAP